MNEAIEIMPTDKALQCPTCGRIREDWGNDDTKELSIKLNKDKQRDENTDRAIDYRKWRWGVGSGCYVADIDQLEYRFIYDSIKPVALLELTRVDGNIPLPNSYLDAVLRRFRKRDAQSKLAIYVASMLNCKAWIVLFRWNLSEYWLYNLTNNRGWYKSLSPETYKNWLQNDCGNDKELN